jgi:hypothetical protein
LKVRDVHVFFAVTKCGSMGRAAEELSVSQPAIFLIQPDDLALSRAAKHGCTRQEAVRRLSKLGSLAKKDE